MLSPLNITSCMFSANPRVNLLKTTRVITQEAFKRHNLKLTWKTSQKPYFSVAVNKVENSPHVTESGIQRNFHVGIRNPGHFLCWNPESSELESGIH